MSASSVWSGVAVGVLYGLVAVGLILVYRTNRIINFAVAAIGAIPGITALHLMTGRDAPYWVGLLVTVVGGLGLGAAVEVLVVRRFSDSPRLILTVATLGISQALAFAALQIPALLGTDEGQLAQVTTPFKGTVVSGANGGSLVSGDQLVAVATVAALTAALAIALRRSRYGVALRASAENAERALLLGIPVTTVQTLAWAVAGLFGAVTIFLRGPLFGVPIDGTLGPGILLFSLAAATIARFERLPLAVAAGVGIGVLEQVSFAESGSANLAYALMVAVILVALAVQRATGSRALATGQASWQAVAEPTAVPAEVAASVRGRIYRVGPLAGAAVLAVAAPYLVGDGDRADLSAIAIFAMVSVSMVVLSGWAGQVSLGQFGLVAAGAAVGGGLAANHDVDLFVALGAATLAGVVVAVVLGLPAVRLPGIYLAVVTLAFAAAAEYWFLDPRYLLTDIGVMPSGDAPRIRPPYLFGRIDLADPLAFYFVSLAGVAVALLVARSFRRNRSGRVLIAVRDNPGGAAAFGIDACRSRLAAFAVSGGIAGLAGGLLAYQQQAIDPATYGVTPSILVFLAAAIGGLTSLPGAVLAAVVINGVRLFGNRLLFDNADLLVSGPGLLIVLLVAPGGVGQLLDAVRTRTLRLGGAAA